MGAGDKTWMEHLTGAFPPFTWPTGLSPAETVLSWIDAQQKFFAAATEASRQVWTIAHKEVETGNGIVQRLVTAKTPEEAVAAQRDLVELMSSVYVEQINAIGEQVSQLAQTGAAGKNAAEPAGSVKKKRATR